MPAAKPPRKTACATSPVRAVAKPAAASPPARVYGGVDADERREQRRQRFIQAGMQLFGTRGLAHTTMRDLCATARLTDRYFYESFKSVNDVFDAVHACLREDLVQRLGVAMSKAEPRAEALAEAGLRAYFSFVREDPRRARIMMIDAVGSNAGPEQLPDLRIDDYVDLIAALRPLVYPNLDDHAVDVRFVINGLIGMCVLSAVAWAQDGFRLSLDQVVCQSLYAWRGLDAWLTDVSSRPRTTRARGARG